MPWTERQCAMLREMGLDVLPPPRVPAPTPAAEPTTTAAARAEPTAPAAAPARAPAAAAPMEAPASAPARPPAAMPAPADAPPLSERQAEIARMEWPELRAAVASCTACGLCQTRRHTVFGVGHEQARWMIVGEAPGEQEDLKGEPFVGAAGQLLDNMLAALQLTRDEATPERQVYIANTLKCRPPQNRNPQPQELQQCEPFLQRQVALVQPTVILAMGRFAVQTLLRSSEPIGRLRGRVHRYEGVPVVVTYHPAYLLRSLTEKAKAWDDLCLAAEVYQRATTAAQPARPECGRLAQLVTKITI